MSELSLLPVLPVRWSVWSALPWISKLGVQYSSRKIHLHDTFADSAPPIKGPTVSELDCINDGRYHRGDNLQEKYEGKQGSDHGTARLWIDFKEDQRSHGIHAATSQSLEGSIDDSIPCVRKQYRLCCCERALHTIESRSEKLHKPLRIRKRELTLR